MAKSTGSNYKELKVSIMIRTLFNRIKFFCGKIDNGSGIFEKNIK